MQGGPPRDVRVLHVDDDPDFADLTATFLSKVDDRLEVVTEHDAEAGLERLREEPIDCVVSDYQMPGTDGLAFLGAVREDHPDLPFILFTGEGSEEIASEAISLGVTDYLQKGGGADRFEMLANRVEHAVAGYRAERRAERERARFVSLAETSTVGILVVDADGTVAFANPATREVLGYDPADLEGEPLSRIVPPRLRDRHEAAIEAYLETGERTLDWSWVEFPGRHADGHEVPLAISFSEFELGGERFFTAILRDVSDRLEDLDRYRTIVDAVGDAMFVLDDEGTIEQVNDAMAEWLDTPVETLVGSQVDEFFPAEAVERGEALVEALLEDGDRKRGTLETRTVDADGEEVVNETSVSVLTEGDEHVGTVGVIRDVTERTRREEAMADQRSLLDSVVEASIDGVLVVDENREYVTYNEQFVEMWGVPEDLLEDHPEETALSWVLDELDDPAEFIEAVEYLYEHPEERSRDQVALRDGRVFDRYSAPVEAEDGTHYGRVWFFRDVTERVERQRTIETLHDVSRTLMRAESKRAVAEVAVEAVRDVLDMPVNTVWLYDEEEHALLPVASTERAAEVIGDPPRFDPGGSLAWEAFETGEMRTYADVRTAPDRYNPETPVRSELVLPLGEFGVLVAGSTEVGAFDDVDASLAEILGSNVEAALGRAERERELAVASERLELALDGADLGVYDWYVQAEEITFDDRIAEMLGYEPDEFEQGLQAWIERTHPEDLPAVMEKMVPVYEGEQHDLEPSEYRVRAKSGEWRWIRTVGTVVEEDDAGRPTRVIGVHQDVTARREREQERIRQNERLSEFASIVSHDLRNPLNVAEGRLGMAREDRDDEHLAAVADALSRMEALIDDLLALARQGELVEDREPVSLAALVEGCWRNVDTADATLAVETDASVLADESRLKQLFENLFRNSVEHGGEAVTVTVGDVEGGFYVADDGPGIPADERERVFESGYSTASGGTGFGLAIVSQIAEAHGWDVEVVEGGSGGARFEVTGVDAP